MTDLIIDIQNLDKEYNSNDSKIIILEKINFNLQLSNIVSVVGPSGCGKSTLLNILGMLDTEFSGQYKFCNNLVKDLSTNKKNVIRNKLIGFVHQFFQRVAIARALINKPKLIIADEITGNLDQEIADSIFDFFLNEIKNNKQSLVFVTHNQKYAKRADIGYGIKKKKLIKL